MTQEIPDDVKRWTAKRRQALILQLVRGETTPAEAARKYGLTVREVEEWRDKALAAMENNALRSRPRDEAAQQEQEIKRLKQKVGELVMDLDVYKEAMRGHPFGRKMLNESDE